MELQNLIQTLKEGVSPFQSVDFSQKRLEEAGFTTLSYETEWNLAAGGKYVLNHHGTCMFAFTIGKDTDIKNWNSKSKKPFLRMAGAHTDYPTLRIKPNPDFQTEAYAQVNTEVYGGPILNTWLDRPLGIAGRVTLKSDDVFAPKQVLYCSKRPVLIIPNLAIHMNREVNKGVEINNQIDLMPIADLLSQEAKSEAKADTDYFMCFLAQELGTAKEDILDFELFTYIMDEPQLVGISKTMLSAPRLDNQTSVCALVSALMDGTRDDGVNLIALFDHEEIGNESKQGAASLMLNNLVRRILKGIGANDERAEQIIYQAMMLSVDVAHALHPNKVGKMDITNHPVMGKGFCIKQSSSQSYATDAEAISILRQICANKNVPYQCFVNRSDMRGGSTLGAIASSLIPMRTVDIGIPLLAMHSSCELMGAADQDALKGAVEAFFEL